MPQRNKNFTGREDLLRELRKRVTTEVTAVLPHTLQGLGGVGKTQLATEYAYRYSHEYDLVWWITADQETLVRGTLAALAPYLKLTGTTSGRVGETAGAVLDALRRGEPYRRWLLIFDNADQPESIRSWIPHGPGHVLVTSRNHRWQGVADTIEIDVFARPESMEFLHRRVPAINGADADQLAEELGDLPLALDQAGSLMAETAMPVDTYLELLNRQSSKILQENPPSDYPVSVAAAWGVSMTRLRDQMPHALDLLRRCAHFGPDPIPIDLLSRGRHVLGPPLKDVLNDPILMSRAIRELGRYALAKIDNYRKTLQVHRLIQRLIRDEISTDESKLMRREVHLLLAASDPEEPDDPDNWRRYGALLPHFWPSALWESTDREVRRLALNLVRYLYITGDYEAAMRAIERTLQGWNAESSADDRDVLVMSNWKAAVLRGLGEYAKAHKVREVTLEKITALLGPDHEETLIVRNGYGVDLRSLGRFAEARELDEESLARHHAVFTKSHRRSFMAANNLALDYNLTSDYEAARRLDEQIYEDRKDFYGRDDHPEVLRSLSALARDLRQAGKYAQARELGEQTYRTYQSLVRRGILNADHPSVLQQAKDLSVARRKDGALQAALSLAEDVYQRYVRRFGDDHPDTLAAAINLGNAARVAGEFEKAVKQIEDTVKRYRKDAGPGHPYTHGCLLNLAIVYRQAENPAKARELMEAALKGLRETVGPDHHYTLICTTNLASALADLEEHEAARRHGEDALPRFRKILGKDHPHTLACAANLALDLRELGEVAAADELFEDTVELCRRSFGEDHLITRTVLARKTLDFDFEPPPL